MNKECAVNISLERNRLMVSAATTTGETHTIERGGDSVNRINALTEVFRQLVVLRSFAKEGDTALITKTQEMGTELYDLFLRGLEELLFDCSSIFVRHQTYLLPIELAYDGEQFVGMRYSVGNWIERSGDVSRAEHRSHHRQNVRLLFLGPEEDSVWQPLNAKSPEWQCDAVKTTAVDSLLARLKHENYDILHFACHGQYDERKPDSAFWILNDTFDVQDDRTLLRCNQLKYSSLRHQPLVFLNACQSGTVSRDYRGFVGFADALLRAGATNCIATLWSITDYGAATFAKQFYSEILLGGSIGEALRRARMACWENRDAALSSLSYILFGDPSRRIQSSPEGAEGKGGSLK